MCFFPHFNLKLFGIFDKFPGLSIVHLEIECPKVNELLFNDKTYKAAIWQLLIEEMLEIQYLSANPCHLLILEIEKTQFQIFRYHHIKGFFA